MTKKLITLLLVLAPFFAFAQEKIAFLNSQEIFNAMPELADIESQLTKKQEQITKDGQAIVDEFNKKAEEFQKNLATLSETAKADQQKQLDQLNERYQLFVQNSQKETQELQQKLLAPVYQKINDAIKAVGDEKGYTYIFDLAAGNILYHSTSATDATSFVKAKLGIK